MRCVWCDSEYTFTGGEHISLDAVMDQVKQFGCRLVEVTGGEPLAQPQCLDLMEALCSADYEVLLETGGFFSTENVDPRVRVILDLKCPASGEVERNYWPNLERLRADKDEVKFVIATLEDWAYSRKVIEDYDLISRTKAVLVSPAWGLIDLQLLAESVAASGLDVRMQLQLHKYIWGPEARGV
jgi:7-carboxy-7-deazaguanine synthase